MSQQNQKPLSATERLNNLEQAVMSSFQGLDSMNRDIQIIKDAIKLLGNKVNSIVQLSQEGTPLNDTTISAQMVKNTIEELAAKIQDLVNQGVLTKEDAITENSFVVLRESALDGTIVQARLQTTMTAIPPDVSAKLIGARAGETVVVVEGSRQVEIIETYKIVVQEAPEAQETPVEVLAETPAEEAASS